jgi:hypothetical protein
MATAHPDRYCWWVRVECRIDRGSAIEVAGFSMSSRLLPMKYEIADTIFCARNVCSSGILAAEVSTSTRTLLHTQTLI